MGTLEDLEKLYELKQKGIISQEEFDVNKEKLLQTKKEASTTYALQAYKDYWKKSFVWNGRANLAEYWWPYLFNMLLGFVFGFIVGILSVVSGKAYIENLQYLLSIILLFPSLAVYVRRFHDLGKSALFAFVPLLLLLVIGIFAALDVGMRYTQGTQFLPSKSQVAIYTLFGGAFIVCSIIWFVFLFLPGQKTANKYGEPR